MKKMNEIVKRNANAVGMVAAEQMERYDTGALFFGVGKCEPAHILKAWRNLLGAFPKLAEYDYIPEGQSGERVQKKNRKAEQLARLVRKEHWTPDRLNEAVDHAIRTCVYPEPTIADILRYGSDIRVASEELFSRDIKVNQDYRIVSTARGEKSFAHADDVAKYRLPLYRFPKRKRIAAAPEKRNENKTSDPDWISKYLPEKMKTKNGEQNVEA